MALGYEFFFELRSQLNQIQDLPRVALRHL